MNLQHGINGVVIGSQIKNVESKVMVSKSKFALLLNETKCEIFIV